jgi:hypothetical protein
MNMADLDDQTTTYDSQQLAEEIAQGEEQAPQVNVEADYERSKQFDVADIDRTGKGAEAASKTTSSASSPATGNPDEFLDMAKQVQPDSDR